MYICLREAGGNLGVTLNENVNQFDGIEKEVYSTCPGGNGR